MSIASQIHVAEEMKSLQICVDSYEDKAIAGMLYHTSLPSGARFSNLMQLLLCIEHILDGMEFPRASTEKRRFTKGSTEFSLGDDDPDTRRSGLLGTFYVRMMFRQNTSWQGSVLWKEGGSELVFRSTLELMLLLDSALGA